MNLVELINNPKVFKKSYAVETYNTSFFQTIKISDLFKYLQEVASLHSESMKIGYSDLASINGAWVLTKELLEIERLPKSLERFTIHTWSHKYNKIFATRNFLVTDQDGNVLLKAVSDWLVLNLLKRRIIPLTKVNLDSIQSYDLKLISEDLSKIEVVRESLVNTFSKRVRFSDIDINGHMNNTCYIDMVLDSIAEYFDKRYQLKLINTNFIQEVKYLDEIIIKTYQHEKLVFHHEILTARDNKQVFTATTSWENS